MLKPCLNWILPITVYVTALVYSVGPAQSQGIEPKPRLFSTQLKQDLLAQGFTLKTPSPTIEETDTGYIVKVPLTSSQDAKNIRLKVDPFRIQVSGRFPLRSPDGKRTFGSSSFMKSYATNARLNPDRVKQVIRDNTLVFTVPKVHPGKPEVSPLQPSPQKPVPPNDLQRKLQKSPKSFI